ncbi:MAG: FtsX-like permease family protein [Candidatus Aminicenantales bacterium]
MVKFLFKGIIRDRSRSLFPFLTVLVGVFCTVALYCYIRGGETLIVRLNANYQTGHLKVMTRAYAGEADQTPNDLAFIGVEALGAELKRDFPNVIWTPRIRFGGLLDIPDDQGETLTQGPTAGIGVDLFSPSTRELEILDLRKALVRGRMPEKPGEILISDEFAQKLKIEPGHVATLISSTMHGSMSMANFIVAGTVRFGVSAMDRAAMIADLADIQDALDMKDAAGEILGFFDDFIYSREKADQTAAVFNARYRNAEDDYAPLMVTLRDQGGLDSLLSMFSYASGILIAIFLLAMSLVLWNAGLIGNLRRYGEIGVRLAMGEEKGHVYRSMLIESLVIAFFGSMAGTAIGLALSYYLQATGINIASLVKNTAIMMPTVLRSRVTLSSYVIGFIPGFFATFLGTAISGIGIYKRQTSQLFKELET